MGIMSVDQEDFVGYCGISKQQIIDVFISYL